MFVHSAFVAIVCISPFLFVSSDEEAKAGVGLKQFDGEIERSDNIPDSPVIAVTIVGRFSDDNLKIIQNFKKIRNLILLSTDISDKGVAHLENLKELRTINLRNSKITSASLAHLTKLPRLERLLVAVTLVSDLTSLEKMKNLKTLNLHATPIVGKALESIA